MRLTVGCTKLTGWALDSDIRRSCPLSQDETEDGGRDPETDSQDSSKQKCQGRYAIDFLNSSVSWN